MFAYCGNNPVNNSDPTGHAFGAIIGGIIGGILGGISAAASGKSVVTGIATGALTGAIVGGICDGTTWAVGAVFGAMVKCAAVAAVGNVLNQTINYGIETYRSNKSHNTANGTQARNTAATSKANKPEQSVVHNYFNYLDGGEVLR